MVTIITKALRVLACRDTQVNVGFIGCVQNFSVDRVDLAIVHDEEIVCRLKFVRVVADEMEPILLVKVKLAKRIVIDLFVKRLIQDVRF